MNLGGKVQLVIADVPGNLPVPFISNNLDDIPSWNWKVDEYIVVVLILLKSYWPLMGLSCYFTQMTLKF
jgi:hypothetical protein